MPTPQPPAVKRWLKRHARFHLHFTPTSGSWLNVVERLSCRDHRKRIPQSIFKSVDELKQAIMDYLDNHNGHPKPYIWTKTAIEIFSKVARAKQVLESRHAGVRRKGSLPARISRAWHLQQHAVQTLASSADQGGGEAALGHGSNLEHARRAVRSCAEGPAPG